MKPSFSKGKLDNLTNQIEIINLSLIEIFNLANELKYFSQEFYANSKHKPVIDIIRISENQIIEIRKLIDNLNSKGDE